MTSIAHNIGRAIGQSIVSGAGGLPLGALCGFIYAKFADLPVGQSAKAWAVWCAAELALQKFVEVAFKDYPTAKHLIVAAVCTATSIIGIQELQKRGLLGEKMTKFLIVMRTLAVAVNLLAATGCWPTALSHGPSR